MSAVAEKLVLVPELAGTLMTTEEFDSAEGGEEPYVYELINGVLIVTPPPDIAERAPNDRLGQWLWNYRDQHPQGSALDYTVTEHTIRTRRNRRRADRVIWAGLGRLPDPLVDVPTIAIEYVSPGRRSRKRDYETKRAEYAEIRIEEYWIIDRFARTLTVFRREGRRYVERVFHERDVYKTPRLPGFELHLARLFAEADLFRRGGGDDAP
jgi:Uma2 family endonuclease